MGAGASIAGAARRSRASLKMKAPAFTKTLWTNNSAALRPDGSEDAFQDPPGPQAVGSLTMNVEPSPTALLNSIRPP